MKKNIQSYSIVIILFLTTLLLTSCEDVIDLDTETGPVQLVVDGWITNDSGKQEIKLTLSSAYFDNSSPKPALNAEVIINDNLGNTYAFLDTQNTGTYTWQPAGNDTLGHIGRNYTLHIKYSGEEFTSFNEIRRVPPIDSMVYTEESLPFEPEKGPKDGYMAEFYARDLVGDGDCYWIKAFRGRKRYKNTGANISIAYDAAFNAGSSADGLIFIQPVRSSITIDELFIAQDTVGVELHSITKEAFHFLSQVRTEAQNGGIFGTPPTNIAGNIANKNPNGPKALGYFGASAISRAETIIDPAKAKPKD
jgi:hypothetical protein